MTKNPKNWWKVKGEITQRFGSVVACATRLGCSPEAIRLTAQGKCPRIKRRLETLLSSPLP